MATDALPASLGSQSPIGKLLESLGMTREDLTRHSAQMRQFLTADNGSLRALEQSQERAQFRQIAPRETTTSSTPAPLSVPYSSQSSIPVESVAHPAATPQIMMPPHSLGAPSALSTENLAKHSQQYTERDAPRRHREREQRRRSRAMSQSSPTATRPKPSLDMIMQLRSREKRRVSESEESDDSAEGSIKVCLTRFCDLDIHSDALSRMFSRVVSVARPSLHLNIAIHIQLCQALQTLL